MKLDSEERLELINSLPNDLRDIVKTVEASMDAAFRWINKQRVNGEVTREQYRAFHVLLKNAYDQER